MPDAIVPAERGRGGHFQIVQAGRSNGSEGNPSRIEYQYQARAWFAQARGQIGASRFSAEALAAHFAARARFVGGAL